MEFAILIITVIVITIIYSFIYRAKKLKKIEEIIQFAAKNDTTWNKEFMTGKVSETFLLFKNDWNNLSAEKMKSYLSEEYFQRIFLIMEILKKQGRSLRIGNYKVTNIKFIDAVYNSTSDPDNFTVQIDSYYNQSLIDTKTEQVIFFSSSLSIELPQEYWNFIKEDGVWKLSNIKMVGQKMTDQKITDFSKKYNLHYEPFFGWMTIPREGKIFSKLLNNNNVSCDSNHLVGIFDEKIVEFYKLYGNYGSIIKSKEMKNYLVAQAILPGKYKDIVIIRNNFFEKAALSFTDLQKIKTESNDFNNQYSVWSSEIDGVNTLRLLSPNFMEKIMMLSFDLNIEVVGNILYLFTEDHNEVDYEDMLEILSCAFDEVKTL
jgi:hypothetical protein